MSAAPARGAGTKAAVPDYFRTGWTGGHNPWVITIVVTMATFMEILDTSIANVSLPHIAGSMSASIDEATWVLTSYLVSNAIVLPLSGWLANRFGRKRFYMTCVALFTVSSMLCGMAPSLGWLVFFRVLQGVGGGGLGPSEQSILADTFPPEKRGMAFAMYGMAVVFAPAIGPTLGGWITDNFSWRWVFFINVPVGLLSLFLSQRVVTDPPHARARNDGSSIDYVGLALIVIGLGALEMVFDKGQEDDWFNSHFITGCTVVAVVALTAFVIWEWNVENPIVDVKLFRSRNFAFATIMMFVLGMSLFGSTVLLPQFLQVVMGYSAQQAGEALSPGGFLIILMMPFIGVMVGKLDPRKMVAFGFFLTAWALIFMASHLYGGMDFREAVLLRCYQAAGMAFLFVPINSIVYVGMPPEKSNAISGIVNLSRNMGSDIGIAMVTTLLARRSQLHQMNLSSYTNNYNPAFRAQLSGLTANLIAHGTNAVDAAHNAMQQMFFMLSTQASTLAYVDVLKLFGIISGFMIPLAFFTQRPSGPAKMGH